MATYSGYVDAHTLKNNIIEWIRDWFDENGEGCNAIIGISGGIDSSVVAALCVEALGKERVFGVIMPNTYQNDIGDAYKLCGHLDIHYAVINIGRTVSSITSELLVNIGDLSNQTMINLPPRIRMSTLYAVSQTVNGRVANTCNLSEDYIGYSTRYGDSVGDFSPLAMLTKTEVKVIGRILGIPGELIEKDPSDGLCGKTDEDNFGFTYEVLDQYIRTGKIDSEEIKSVIDSMHEKNLFKLQPMPHFEFYGPNVAEKTVVEEWQII